MPNSRQYRYLHKGVNEWLAGDAPSDDTLEEWNEAWEAIHKECPDTTKIEFTEDVYTNSEHADIPEFINVTIKDEYILQFKMARGVIKSIDGVQSVVFHLGIDCSVEDGWGNISHEEIAITDGGAYVTIHAKHSSERVEVDVSEQFNQAIGESV
jgi:hypothetical protein